MGALAKPRLWPCALLCAALWTLTAADWTDCAPACRCKWTSGKKSALCPRAGLTAPPASLSADIQVLDLTENQIERLAAAAFSSLGLLNLQRVFLKSTGLREVHKDAFLDLRILVELDLSENALERIHPATFTGNDRLRVLSLSGNPLNELIAEQFPVLPHLRTLDLEDCRLTYVHREAFVHLGQLESLNLRRNRLESLSEAAFLPTGRMKTLALDGNPWRCDCHLRRFRNWFLAGKLPSAALHCADPRDLRGQLWQDVPAEKFACPPEVLLTDRLIQKEPGGNATFGCRVRGDPRPTVTWLFNGAPLAGADATDSEIPLVSLENGLQDTWINVTLFNLSDVDAGEYSCSAENSLGYASQNLTLSLPEIVAATTLSAAPSWLLLAGAVCGSVIAAIAGITGLACAVYACERSGRRKRHRRKAKIQGSASFTDQEKKLLDASITTERASGAGSCEVLGGPRDTDLAERVSPPPCGPRPVHITIESHDRRDPLMAYPATLGPPTRVFPPPPPEFSAGAFGNIFISVSVARDGNVAPSPDGRRFPDLLDIAPRPLISSITPTAIPTERACCVQAPYATLPRRPTCRATVVDPGPPIVPRAQYDNMGPRVTAGGSSTLSLPGPPVSPVQSDPPEVPPAPPPPQQECSTHAEGYVSL
ncbi:leucine-rich repeat-containing protein 24-like [Ctenocephalides felis]|uniref:leucine-rich repeat-containing protein 24-like n=1 Tax=Ctenocephalides felis TaxID=7515 RepID=UPI000E6E2968|nr:leucine-rich repeat-containing protein 24-like [Ctenocephalides felis]